MAKLIGFSGLAGAGKDAAVATLTGTGRWERRAFADKMRQAVLALDPIVEDDTGYGHVRLSYLVHALGWDDAKRQYPEVRRLLQKFGTEAGRDTHGENCWVDALLRDWTGQGARGLAISDLRFRNEAEAIVDRGGITVRIERPGVEPVRSADGTIHSSETSLDGFEFDVVILNDGSLGDLADAVGEAASRRRCKDCLVVRPASSFASNPGTFDGLNTYCRPCESERMRAWREKNREKVSAASREHHLVSTYGMNSLEFDQLLAGQGGVCALCLRSPEEAQGSQKNLAVDHNHNTGRVRGILCNSCNSSLVPIERDPGWVARATNYLMEL